MQYYPRKRLSNQSINITPLIDIVFILLVFFMLTSHFINEKRFEVSLPDAKSGDEGNIDEPVFINISLMGHLYQADRLLSDEQLDALLLQMVEKQQSLVPDSVT